MDATNLEVNKAKPYTPVNYKKITEYKIEKNVPLPTGMKFPLTEMEIGDSICVGAYDKKTHASVISHVKRVTKCTPSLLNKRFTIRIHEGNIRIWRVDPATKKSEERPLNDGDDSESITC